MARGILSVLTFLFKNPTEQKTGFFKKPVFSRLKVKKAIANIN